MMARAPQKSSQRRSAPKSKRATGPVNKAPKKRGLRGKGPTPRAEDRPYHKAAKAGKPSRPPRTPRGESQERDRGREREKVHVDSIAGRNVVLEALRAGIPAKELVVAIGIDIDDRIREIVDLAKTNALPIREVPRNRLDTLTGIAHHQGIALIAKPFQYSSQKEIFQRASDPALFIAVDEITDPRNIGAIIRSAAAFGADGILIPERRSAGITAAACKASAGAVARIPVAQITNLVRSIEAAKERGCFIVGLEGGSQETLETMKIADQPLYIIVGSEGKGLSRLVREKCDLLLSIPISSKVESLNASVAVSIALYGIAAKRRGA